MGYYSEHWVTTDGPEAVNLLFIAELRISSADAWASLNEHGGPSGELVSWDRWPEDVIDLSVLFPGLAIRAHRQGITDPDDEEVIYITDGRAEESKITKRFTPSWKTWLKSMGRK